MPRIVPPHRTRNERVLALPLAAVAEGVESSRRDGEVWFRDAATELPRAPLAFATTCEQPLQRLRLAMASNQVGEAAVCRRVRGRPRTGVTRRQPGQTENRV